MTQSREKKPTIEQVLKLVDQLSADERIRLVQHLNDTEFQCEIQKGIDAADRGELKPADEVIDRLRKRAQSRT